MRNTDEKPGGPRRQRDWTLMVYMAAENTSELDAVAVEDLREMEKGANNNVYVAVQINRAWPAVPQRYEIRTDGANQLPNEDSELTDMGDGKTLTGFLTWAVTAFPAKHYCLVLWGHAYGLGFGRDHGDALSLDELRKALQAFRDKRQDDDRSRTSGDGRLELLGANACAMSYVEAAYELRNHAHHMVASQIAVPYAGWPYESILCAIDSKTNSKDLGRLVVDAYISHFNALVAGERVTMSLLNLGALEVPEVFDFKNLFKKLAVAIREESRAGGPFGERRAYVRDVFLAAASGDVRPLVDLKDLCEDLQDLCDDLGAQSTDLFDTTTEVLRFLKDFVIHHNGHPDLLEDLHGVGIFAPFVAGDDVLKGLELLDDGRNGGAPKEKGRQAYEELALFSTGEKVWPRLVYDELRQAPPSEFIASLAGLSAAGSADRRDITQIVLAIESSFNKLDRVLTEGTRRMDQELDSATKREPSNERTAPLNSAGGKRFGPPWLELIPAPDLDAQVATLKQLLTLKAFERAAIAAAGRSTEAAVSVGSVSEPNIDIVGLHPELLDSMRSVDSTLVSAAVDFLARVEKAVGEVERATRKGLTHARLGLGPSAPDRFTFTDLPRPGGGSRGFAEDDNPKPGGGSHGFIEDDNPKPGGGSHGDNGFQASPRDLRVDLAFARVIDLFGRVGQSLRQLEDATLELESIARTTLSNAQSQQLTRHDMLKAAGQRIRRALAMVEDASKVARRTTRGVLSHPVYGLGPGSDAIGMEEREALANAGGLSRRNLRLL